MRATARLATLAGIAALLAATTAFALSPTPSGRPSLSAPKSDWSPQIDLSQLQFGTEASKHVHLTDGFGYCWDLTATISGNTITFTGSVLNITSYPWVGSGSADRSTGQQNLRADNPQADGCVTYADWFTYSGTGGRTPSGSWANACGLTGTWNGRWAGGGCP